MELKLTKGLFAIVDDEDYQKVCHIAWFAQEHKIKIGSYYYAVAGFPGEVKRSKQKKVRLHRYILGVTDPKMQVDHINGDTLDCRKSNLRIATHGQNQQNRRKSLNKASKYKGVIASKSFKNPWRAQIKPQNKLISLGGFPTEEQAAIAYNIAAQKFYGEFARLNII